MSRLFAPSSPIEILVHAGDVAGTLDFLRPLPIAERAKLRTTLAAMNRLMRESGWKSQADPGLHWGARPGEGQERAVAAALLLSGTAGDVAETRLRVEDVITLAREFELPCLPGLAEALLAVSPQNIRLVQALIAAGLVQRPDSEAYALGLIALPRVHRRGERFEDLFDADPGLAQALLRMFDIEGTADTCLSSIDKYNSADNAWSRHLLNLCGRGLLSRAALLDRTLAALERDWPQYRSGWFSRFHDELAPDIDELRAHAGRYLQLCLSRIPPTVGLALGALATLQAADALEPARLLAALRPVMATGNKRQLESALALLDRCVQRDPALAEDAAEIACAGLVHEAPPLQARILRQVGQRGPGEIVRAALRRHLPGIAPSNRAALQKLLGDATAGTGATAGVTTAPTATPVGTPQAAQSDAQASTPAGNGRVSPLDESRRLVPLAGLDALVQAIAHVFENDQDMDAFELALAGLVQAAPIAPEDRARFGPVLKRAARLVKPVPASLARLLVFVLTGEGRPSVGAFDSHGFASEVSARLSLRIDALMALAAQGRRLPPLSTPTHRRGFIAPDDLVERTRLRQQQGLRDSTGEQVLALLRLAGPFTTAHRERARTLADTPFVRALRYALGDDVAPGGEQALFSAAARIRHPGSDDDVLLRIHGDLGPDGPKAARYAWDITSWQSEGEPAYWFHTLVVGSAARPKEVGDLLAVAAQAPPAEETSWGALRLPRLAGHDPGLVEYFGTWMPGDMQAFFAEGVRALGNNLDWWEARWEDQLFLAPLLDPAVAPGAMGTLLLACALGAKEPGQQALAADALVALQARGELDLPLLSATLRRLLCTPLVKAARYRKAFDAALRIDPGLAPGLVALLSAAIPYDADPPPKDIAKWLELLRELLPDTGLALDTGVKTAIAGMKLGGAGRALQKQLAAG